MITREPGWVLLTPDGRVDGLIGWQPWRTTAEAAHAAFTRRKRDRDREIREGWTLRREQPDDRNALLKTAMEATDEDV